MHLSREEIRIISFSNIDNVCLALKNVTSPKIVLITRRKKKGREITFTLLPGKHRKNLSTTS